MPDRRLVLTLIALALVLGAAVGYLAVQGDDLQPPLLLLVAGGCLVGGIARSRWWVGALVGAGVPTAFVWARAAGYPLPETLSLVPVLLAPPLALAAAGLGAAMLRHIRED